MVSKVQLACLLLLCSSLACAAEPTRHFVQKLALPSGQTAVVAEGDFEARSIGSYSVRIYSTRSAQPDDDTTFFSSGVIRARDGTVDKVFLANLGNDGAPSLVVAIRSVGSGGYLSADAFTVGKNTVVLRASVAGLAANADPVVALKSSLQGAEAEMTPSKNPKFETIPNDQQKECRGTKGFPLDTRPSTPDPRLCSVPTTAKSSMRVSRGNLIGGDSNVGRNNRRCGKTAAAKSSGHVQEGGL